MDQLLSIIVQQSIYNSTNYINRDLHTRECAHQAYFPTQAYLALLEHSVAVCHLIRATIVT